MTPTEEPRTDPDAAPVGANPGYVLGQLGRALQTSREHDDPATRERAGAKVRAWVKVFQGLISGALRIGSRTPVPGAPAWATLEVARGGFATGELAAGGPLRPHERDLLARLPAAAAGAERAALNAYYLTDAGFAELRDLLETGRYRVTVPEEGALLAVAWLLGRGDADAARGVLDAIGPFLPRLRFYPVPAPTPPADGPVVHLQTVGETAAALAAVRDRPDVLAQREAVRVWAPLYDRFVSLFAETVEGPPPALRTTPDGQRQTDAAGRFVVEGGWPCQRYPDGWRDRAAAAVKDYRRLRKEHRRCGGPDRPRGSFARLRGYLETCARDPRRLTGRDVGMIRLILAGVVTKRGLPGSASAREYRQAQAAHVAGPSVEALAKVLAGRLAGLPQDGGIDALDEVTRPVTPAEADRHGVPAGAAVPDRLAGKLRRALAAPVPALVEAGVIPSAEVLARVVPQLTAQARAAGIADPALRRLYGAVYTAFRRRRSLLLLNLQGQVKLGELPWVQAIEPYRPAGGDEREQARQALAEVVALAVTAFPEQILPNKLLQEVRALADAAGLDVPVVDELAADIFMGEFSGKFVRSAQAAAALLTGTLYERYYGVPFDRVLRIDDVKPSRYGTATSPAFARLCAELAGEAPGRGWSVARNGKIIEQQQVLTTHNLAALFAALGLTDALRPRLRELAGRCFAWVCRRLQQTAGHGHARLRAVKNAAYAWRQMVFFLALLPAGEVAEFLARAEAHLADQPADFRDRFWPALDGLRRAADGGGPGGRPFLGWTTGPHWLLA